MDNEDGLPVKVYVTTSSLTEESVRSLLYNEEMGSTDLFEIETLYGYASQDICRAHRENHPRGGPMHSRVFVIFDSDDHIKRGALVVTLRAYHGYPDAVRHLLPYAALCAGSLSIDHSHWAAERQSTFTIGEEGLDKVSKFALYSLVPDDEQTFDDAARAIDEGIQWIDADEPTSSDENAHVEDITRISLDRYYVLKPESHDIDDIFTRHRQIASKMALDENYFAIVDRQRGTQRTLLAQVEPKDEVRCKGPPAGELLWWIAIGFMNWEDAKKYASSGPIVAAFGRLEL